MTATISSQVGVVFSGIMYSTNWFKTHAAWWSHEHTFPSKKGNEQEQVELHDNESQIVERKFTVSSINKLHQGNMFSTALYRPANYSVQIIVTCEILTIKIIEECESDMPISVRCIIYFHWPSHCTSPVGYVRQVIAVLLFWWSITQREQELACNKAV
jgi:hypothetical protein